MTLSSRPSTRHAAPARPPLIDRRHELDALLDATSSPPAVVMLDGEAGVGKTRLVQALTSARAAGGTRVLLGRCHRLHEPFPLGAVLEALRSLGGDGPSLVPSPVLGALRPLLPELAEHLPAAPESLADTRAERHRQFRAVRELLAQLGPTLCVLEDLHWADPATLEFLSFAAADVPPGLALVLTYRTEQVDRSSPLMDLLADVAGPSRTCALRLGPLCPEGVGRLAAATLRRDAVSREVRTRLHEWTGGIPRAVEEVLRLRPAQSALDVPAVPRCIGDAVLARLARVSADAARLVTAAAVLAAPAGETVLMRVADLPAPRATAALVEALAAGLLVDGEDGRYGLRHGLAARAVYDATSAPERRALHLRAGRALGDLAQPPLAEIADHLRQASAPGWASAAERAAEAARQSGDDVTASRLLESALAAPNISANERVRMALALGDAAFYSSTPANAIATLRRILAEEHLGAGVRGRLRFALTLLLGQAGDTAAWREESARAIADLRRRPDLAVRLMVNLAQPLWHSDGALEEHLGWLRRATETAERQGDPATRIVAVAQRAAILVSLGDRRGWAGIGDIPNAGDNDRERLQLLRGYHALAAAALSVGYFERAESLLGEAERIHAQLGRRSCELWLATTRASLDWYGGRWDGLDAGLRALLEETATSPSLSACNRFVLGSLLLARGDLDAAQTSLQETLESARRVGAMSQVVTASGRLARVHLERGDADAAWTAAALGIEAVRGKPIWVSARSVVPEAIAALLLRGDHGRARELIAEFACGLRGRDAPAARAALASARGSSAEAEGRHEAAEKHFARAEAGWQRLANRYEAARARECRARCQTGDAAAARAVLASALAAFQRLGADGDARRARAQLIAQGAWRGGRRGYGDELSPRESQVARLAGLGRTNREIAAALFISSRTVEVHVAAALRKLDVRSRHSLVSVVAAGHDETGKDT